MDDKENREYAVLLMTVAASAVGTDRGSTHGSMKENFQATASLWSAWLGCPVSAFDVAIMMDLLKTSRLKHGKRDFDDHYVDKIGYTSIAGALAKQESENG